MIDANKFYWKRMHATEQRMELNTGCNASALSISICHLNESSATDFSGRKRVREQVVRQQREHMEQGLFPFPTCHYVLRFLLLPFCRRRRIRSPTCIVISRQVAPGIDWDSNLYTMQREARNLSRTCIWSTEQKSVVSCIASKPRRNTCIEWATVLIFRISGY